MNIHICIYTFIFNYIYMPIFLNINKSLCIYTHMRGLSGKSLAIVNIMNLAAKESGLECTCVNNGDFTVLVSGGGRCC